MKIKTKIAEWDYESSSSSKIYKVIMYDDSSFSCNCPSWVFKRGNERNCKHCEAQRQINYVNVPKQEVNVNISGLNDNNRVVEVETTSQD